MSAPSERPADPKLDYRRIDREAAREEDFPAKIHREYRVHITEEAYEAMKKHAGTTDEVELCGVLIGEVCRDKEGVFLKITGAIEGEGAGNYGSQVTFTHDTWSHINAVKDEKYPEEKIVGWYHTHPGFGVFLSSMDTFIQENFFNQPYQVALVLETKARQEGCFVWQKGKCRALKRYWVGKREVTLTAGEAEPFTGDPAGAAPAAAPAAAREGDPAGPLGLNLSTLLLVLLAFLVGLFFGETRGYKGAADQVMDSLQGEYYSLLSEAAVTLAAASDLYEVSDQLTAVRSRLPESEGETAARLDRLLGDLALMNDTYQKRQGGFRREIEVIANRHQSLGGRLGTLEDLVRELKWEIMIQHVEQILDRLPDRADYARLTRGEKGLIRELLDEAAKLVPRRTGEIHRRLPGLVDFLLAPTPTPQAGNGPAPDRRGNHG